MFQLKKIFLDETVHLFTSFGANETEAVAKAESMLELEKFMTSVSIKLLSEYIMDYPSAC